MVENIKTFVIFDLETTGLIKKKFPKITEIAMVAVSRKSLLQTKENLPRVIWKLLLPVNPVIEVEEKAAEISKLTQKILENAYPFGNEIFDAINDFIALLEKPVCLLAHNGTRHDYPILLKELSLINKSLGQDILAVDTLELFRTYYKELERPPLSQNNFPDDGFEAVLCAEVDKYKADPLLKLEQEVEASLLDSTSTPSISALQYTSEMQKKNEKTPKRQIIQSVLNAVPKKLMYTNEKGKNNEKNSIKPTGFSLGKIYAHMFNKDITSAHNAEGDCIALLECICKIGNFAVDWIDSHAKPLKDHGGINV